MRKMRSLLLLTLASNKNKVAVAVDNIAFALWMEGADEHGKPMKFTRVFLKHVIMEDMDKWVDVIETPEELLSQVAS